MQCNLSTVDLYHQKADIETLYKHSDSRICRLHSTLARLFNKEDFLLLALFMSTSHLALLNVCYEKEHSKLCPDQLRIRLTTFTRVHMIAKRNYLLRHVCLSVCVSVGPFASNN